MNRFLRPELKFGFEEDYAEEDVGPDYEATDQDKRRFGDFRMENFKSPTSCIRWCGCLCACPCAESHTCVSAP